MTTTTEIDIIKQVKNIEINTKNLVDGLICGNYHSIFKGQGIEFSEIRDYRVGDDIRSIDWKVTARYNSPYIKEFIEERDLNVYFVFDYSASSNFGNKIDKKIKAIELTASLMFSALKNNDNVGLFLFTEEIEKYIPAKKGKKHVMQLIRTLLSHEAKSKNTNIQKSLSSISNIIKKRSVIFLISDFLADKEQDFIKPLKFLKNKNDLIAIRINDLREHEIPDVGLIQLEDEETGEQVLVNTSNIEFREEYSKIISKEQDRLDNLFKKHKIDTINLYTDNSYTLVLRKFFKKRERRNT